MARGAFTRILVPAALGLALSTGAAVLTAPGLARGDLRAVAVPARALASTGGAVRCQVSPAGTAHRPALLVLGASFTAGVGAPEPTDSWAVRLAVLLGWRAVTLGVPGAGYTSAGLGHLGPLGHELRRVDLAVLRPSLVIVQAGHDDGQVPVATETQHVEAFVHRLAARAPHARLAFLTVFARPGASRAALRRDQATDAAIVAAARRADPRAIVIDPLREHWRFPHADGGRGLHPTAQGHQLIAARVARALAQAGLRSHPGPAAAGCSRLGGGPRPGRSADRQAPFSVLRYD